MNAYGLQDPANLEDTVSINLRFGNGSIGTICYFSNGPKALPKEYLEIYKGGVAARLTDFREVEILGGKKRVRKKLASQDKGQRCMVEAFVRALRNGEPSPIPTAELFATTLASFAVVDSLRGSHERAVSSVQPNNET